MWNAIFERALWTFGQGFLAVFVVLLVPSVEAGFGMAGVDWVTVLSAAALAGVLSVAKSLAVYFESGSVSVGGFEYVPERAADGREG